MVEHPLAACLSALGHLSLRIPGHGSGRKIERNLVLTRAGLDLVQTATTSVKLIRLTIYVIMLEYSTRPQVEIRQQEAAMSPQESNPPYWIKTHFRLCR